MKEIRILTPVMKSEALPGPEEVLSSYEPLADESLSISCVLLEEGPTVINNRIDEALAIPGLLKQAQIAEREGVDGLLIDCMGDPGVEELRELISIPVIGPAQSAMHLAANIGQYFGFLAVDTPSKVVFNEKVRRAGLENHYAGSVPVNLSISAIGGGTEAQITELCLAAEKLVNETQADVIIPGCSEYVGVAASIRQHLKERGHDVTVINPVSTAIRLLSLMIEENITHSKYIYPCPSNSTITK